MISNYYILLTMLICLMASSASAGDDKNTLNDPVTPDGLVRPKAAKPLQNTEHQKLGLALNLCRVSDVVGKKVENEHGENLGKIEDVVLDASRGQIVYAVLSFGGILGIGDKLFAIPWTALKDQPGKKFCLLSVDSDGQIVLPVKDAVAGEAEKLPVDKANAHVKAHVNHIFGYRLHDSMLEPAKEYTMPASIHELLGHDSAGSAGQHQMRYEGTTSLDGRQTARFVILLDVSKKASSTAGREVGRAAYRVDDGLLERLVLGSTSIRRIAITVGDAGN